MDEIADDKILRTFVPLDGFKRETVASLARKTGLSRLTADNFLFRTGDSDKKTFYLVAGEVELLQQGTVVATIRGGSIEARSPLAPLMPRRFSARAASDIVYLEIDSDMLDIFLTWDRTGTYEVSEISPKTGAYRVAEIMPKVTGHAAESAADDWMTVLLQVNAFHHVPSANLQQIFAFVEHCKASAGEWIVRQGAPGDYFYVMISGRSVVVRDSPTNPNGILLAELSAGDSFGEESLIADTPRNANVRMLTDGALVRLSKQHFLDLLAVPMRRMVDFASASKIVSSGRAAWIDVRMPDEFRAAHLPGAMNIPLYALRLKFGNLEPALEYIVVCDNGRRSEAATFILTENGMTASTLEGGLNAHPTALA
jgi:CRP-like cAMP-binding protein